MNLQLEPGIYVLAVSGGVDSMALLHMVKQQANPDIRVIVAHFDHGIRPDSVLDQELVQNTAANYGLRFVYGQGNLGATASEAVARKARYEFLHQICKQENATAIVTAHHQDDVLETAIHNMLRGTQRRGLVSLRSRDGVLRPLLSVPKTVLYQYATQHKLAWNEDSTNKELRYRRNYIRHRIVPRLSAEQRTSLLGHIDTLTKQHHELERSLQEYLEQHHSKQELNRDEFIRLPHAVAKEVMMYLLGTCRVRDIDKPLIDRTVWAAKTMAPGKRVDLDGNYALLVQKTQIRVMQKSKSPI
jgi:tRNA(Ile)-lysidine synthetase-like protein